VLDPTAFPNAAELQSASQIGRLNVTSELGDADGDGDYDQLYAFGARSVSIRRTDGRLVWDSGDLLERVTAAALPEQFNATNDELGPDDRSDNKGPEPEGVAVGRVGPGLYAFVGLERIGGVVVLDVTSPQRPEFVQYLNTRDFSDDVAGDCGPEGIEFVPANRSPNGQPLLLVGNEVSRTLAVFSIARVRR
jgi:2',3'-cyclic-nucleotide 2'-phosphodiesterase/3'-nucleotidase/5'-nucleotidase